MPKHKSTKKTVVVNQDDNNCHRCTMQYILSDEEKANLIEEMGSEDFNKWHDSHYGPNKVKKGTSQCDTCIKMFCDKCYKIHDKYNECFIYNKKECAYCGGPGSYDYGVRKVLCVYCL